MAPAGLEPAILASLRPRARWSARYAQIPKDKRTQSEDEFSQAQVQKYELGDVRAISSMVLHHSDKGIMDSAKPLDHGANWRERFALYF